MCVITIVEGPRRPTEVEIKAMWDSNKYGGGLAFREKGGVSWEKALSLEQMQKRNTELPFPYVLHFRIPSSGGDTTQLCHPFPVTRTVSLDFKGHTKGEVLFHNGTWSEWHSQSKQWLAASMGKIKALPGPWSDSRAMAFWAYHFGDQIFEVPELWGIREKVVLFTPSGEIKVYGEGWSEVDGLVVSNEGWCFRVPWQSGAEEKGRWQKARDEMEDKDNKGNKGEDPGFSDGDHLNPPHHTLPNRPLLVKGPNHKRLELVRIDERLPEAYRPEMKAGATQSSIHPFHLVRQKWETAMVSDICWMEGDGPESKPSKGEIKRLRKDFYILCREHPAMANVWFKEFNPKESVNNWVWRKNTDLYKTMNAWDIFEFQRRKQGKDSELPPSVN